MFDLQSIRKYYGIRGLRLGYLSQRNKIAINQQYTSVCIIEDRLARLRGRKLRETNSKELWNCSAYMNSDTSGAESTVGFRAAQTPRLDLSSFKLKANRVLSPCPDCSGMVRASGPRTIYQ